MNTYVLTLAATSCALLAIVRWGAWRASVALVPYLLVILLGDVLALVAPRWAYTPGAWIARDAVVALLRLAVAWELLGVGLGRLPHLLRRAGLWWLGGLLLWMALLVAAGALVPGTGSATYRSSAMLAGTSALAVLHVHALLTRYFIPLHPVARVYLLGLPMYLLSQVLAAGAALEMSHATWWHIAAPALDAAYCLLMVALVVAAASGRHWAPPPALASARWSAR